ncbi:MAG: LL-diaminopimelate aminotransferase [Planctomycetes bacterium]|nr:LL-diaminopimelate aminotransferase [Planctomycetota bacterium]
MPFRPTDRLKSLPPYLFVEIVRKKQELLAAGKDVIDFGVGDPDRPTPQFIIDRMTRAVQDAKNHPYPDGRGSQAFREQIGSFFEQRYGVALDVEREIHALIGSKEGLGHLPLAAVNPGQTVLVPEPGYPVYRAAAIFAGGEPWTLELSEANRWLPDFASIPEGVARSAALINLNYPNNPTGAVATRGFFEDAVAFARRYDILIAHDAAYNEMYFDERPPSILEIDGAKEVAVELHSLSKTFNMTGWRLGFVAGNADTVAALGRIKSNLDSGVFTAVQEAGIEAYAGFERPEILDLRELYHERAEVLASGLREIGFRVAPPKATFYIWAGVPKGLDTMGTVMKLLDDAAVVCIPGTGFGAAGQGYVRFALTVELDRIRAAVARMRELSW